MAMAVAPLRERNARRFAIGDEFVSVRVRESGRAKTARIIVGPQRPLEVIVPAGVEDDEVDALLEEKRDWVERKVDAARAIAARRPQLGLDRPGRRLARRRAPADRPCRREPGGCANRREPSRDRR
jgi:predicted metal-dependent hydrolase